MFGGAWGNFAPPPEDLTIKERSPPPSPVPLDFPRAVPQPQSHALTEESLQNLKGILVKLRSHQDVKREYLEALNVKITSDVSFTDLIPESVDARLPENLDPSLQARPQLSNGMPVPGPERYDILERELRYSNDDAFRELIRLPLPPGKQRLRITQTRKFWAGLEKMAQYWDTSVDQFYEASSDDDGLKADQAKADTEGPADAKRMKMDNSRTLSDGDSMNIDTESGSNSTTAMSPSGDKSTQSRLRYKGRRIGNARTMPEELREETVRGFMEMVAWPFGCQVTMPSMPPRLSIGTMLFPVRHSFTVTRTPKDRMQARKGHMEGPVLAVQCKNEVQFRNDDERVGDGYGEATDLFREVGALLLLAQERARQGKAEVLPGQGKWWTTKARWGGGPGGEMEVPPEGVTDEPPATAEKSTAEKVTPKAEARPSKPAPSPHEKIGMTADALLARAERRMARASGRRDSSASSGPSNSRRLSLAERWKVLKPGSSLWDRKMQYLQIGKIKGDEFDDIFLLSSLNTHISLLHVRIHPTYLLWLSSSSSSPSPTTTPPSTTSPPDSNTLHIRRTKWYNLYDIDERVEALQGMWKLMLWTMRGGETGEMPPPPPPPPTTPQNEGDGTATALPSKGTAERTVPRRGWVGAEMFRSS